jgi:hypothetical protein
MMKRLQLSGRSHNTFFLTGAKVFCYVYHIAGVLLCQGARHHEEHVHVARATHHCTGELILSVRYVFL